MDAKTKLFARKAILTALVAESNRLKRDGHEDASTYARRQAQILSEVWDIDEWEIEGLPE